MVVNFTSRLVSKEWRGPIKAAIAALTSLFFIALLVVPLGTADVFGYVIIPLMLCAAMLGIKVGIGAAIFWIGLTAILQFVLGYQFFY